MSMTKAEIAYTIRWAADIVEAQETIPRGLGKEGCYCAGAAIGCVLRDMGHPAGDSPYADPFNFYAAAKDVWDACGGTDLAHYNDAHSKEETVAHMRAIADELDPPKPKLVTLGDVLPKLESGDPLEMTPKAFRRRLLAWATLLESDYVASHWDYETFGAYLPPSLAGANGAKTYDQVCAVNVASMCGTVACAVGWLFAVPEAWSRGCRPRFLWVGHSSPVELLQNPSDYGESNESTFGRWLGLTASQMSGIIYANSGPDCFPFSDELPALGWDSSPKDVAAVIRIVADKLYPEESIQAEPKAKPKRTERKGTKRYYAKLLRDGAAFLDTHAHTGGKLVRPAGGEFPDDPECFCAMGAIGAAAGGPVDDGLAMGAFLTDLLGKPETWWSSHIPAFGGSGLIHSVAKAVAGYDVSIAVGASVHSANDYLFSDRLAGSSVSTPEAKAKAQRFMRALAYALEHGGKLPPGLAKKEQV